MLVLKRMKDEDVVIGDDNIRVRVTECGPHFVKLGFTADRETPVHRAEVYNALISQGDTLPEVGVLKQHHLGPQPGYCFLGLNLTEPEMEIFQAAVAAIGATSERSVEEAVVAMARAALRTIPGTDLTKEERIDGHPMRAPEGGALQAHETGGCEAPL